MNRAEALDALIEAVDRGIWSIDTSHAHGWCGIHGDAHGHIISAYRGSLDAAKALHEALLPGWGWETGINATFVSIGSVWKSGREKSYIATADSPARAWMLAILKAYRAGL